MPDVSQLIRIIIPEELLLDPRILYQFYIYPIATAVIVSILMLIIYIKKQFFKKAIKKILAHATDFLNNREERQEEERVRESYFSLRKKKLAPRNFISLGFYAVEGLLILMILTKLIFFGIVPTQSMAPNIMPGDLVLAEGLSKNISAGDIIVFNPPKSKEMYVHRVYSIEGETIKTKGDNGPVDPWKITKKNILGKAVTIGEKPIKIGGLGLYFMNVRDPRVASDPAIKSVRNTISTIQIFGPLVSLFIIFFALLTSLKRK